jgi:hypothetical protein
LDTTSNQWKERGVGNLKLNVSQVFRIRISDSQYFKKGSKGSSITHENGWIFEIDFEYEDQTNFENRKSRKQGYSICRNQHGKGRIMHLFSEGIHEFLILNFLSLKVARPEVAEELLKVVEEQKKLVSPSVSFKL